MSSYFRSRILFKGTPEQLQEIVKTLASDDGETPIDFNRIIPLSAEPSEELLLSCWGTEAEPEEPDSILYRQNTFLEYSFNTVGKPPLPVFGKLAEMFPACDLTIEYASEDYGEECGKYISPEGQAELQFTEPEDAFEFACEVWEVDPDEERQERMINEYEE